MSLLAAIRSAVSAAPEEDAPHGAATGASAPDGPAGAGKETDMSNEQVRAGGQQSAGISQADHDAAVKTAREEGRAEGAKAANERHAAALGAEGVKGNAARMSAALDLLTKSPARDGAAVAEFVTANVAAEPAADAKAYEQQRLAASGLAQPGKGKPQGGEAAASLWDKAVAKVNGQG
jgi:hypothetical protein